MNVIEAADRERRERVRRHFEDLAKQGQQWDVCPRCGGDVRGPHVLPCVDNEPTLVTKKALKIVLDGRIVPSNEKYQRTNFCTCGAILFQGACQACDIGAFCTKCGRFLRSDIFGDSRCISCEPSWFITRYTNRELRKLQSDLLPSDRDAQACRRERALREIKDRLIKIGEDVQLEVIRYGLHGQFLTADGLTISVRPAHEARRVPVSGRIADATILEPLAIDDGEILVIAIVSDDPAILSTFYVFDMLDALVLARDTPGVIMNPPADAIDAWIPVLTAVRARRKPQTFK